MKLNILKQKNDISDIKELDENGFDYRFHPINNIDTLKQDWMNLETRSDHSFFQTWPWIETWIHSVTTLYNKTIYQLSIYEENQLVSISLYCTSTIKRCRVIPQKAIMLGECGENLDKITIEYNQDLIASSHRDKMLDLSSNFIFRHYSDHFTVCMPGLLKIPNQQQDTHSSSIIKPRLYYWTDLKKLRESRTDYLSTLSKNTRAKARQSNREFMKAGDLSLTKATSLIDALEYFDELTSIHSRYWQKKNKISDFTTKEVNEFHRRLIKEHFTPENILLYKVHSGKQLIGIFYFLNHNGHIMYYQSGTELFSNNKMRPGITAHTLLIEHFISETTYHSYDFMCGDYQYKKSLSTNTDQLYWIYTTPNNHLNNILNKLSCNFTTN